MGSRLSVNAIYHQHIGTEAIKQSRVISDGRVPDVAPFSWIRIICPVIDLPLPGGIYLRITQLGNICAPIELEGEQQLTLIRFEATAPHTEAWAGRESTQAGG